MKEYKVGNKVLINTGKSTLDEVEIIDIIPGVIRKKYIVAERYRHAIEGFKTDYKEVRKGKIVYLMSEVNK